MDIGKKLKELRLQNDLTLGDLASRSELTKGFLSQVERNLTTPSIATLEDILEALGSSLSEFFREEEEKQIVFPVDDFFVDYIKPQETGNRTDVRWVSLTNDDGVGLLAKAEGNTMEFNALRYTPRAAEQHAPFLHAPRGPGHHPAP